MGGWAAAAAVVGTAITASLNNAEAAKSRGFAKEMRATAYQTTMKDMKRAGLNPILAYKQGATSLQTANQAVMPDFGGSFSQGMAAGTGAKDAESKRDLRDLQKDTEIMKVQALQGQTEASLADARKKRAEGELVRAEIPRANAQREVDESAGGQVAIKARRATEHVAGTAKEIGGAVGSFLGGRRNR